MTIVVTFPLWFLWVLIAGLMISIGLTAYSAWLQLRVLRAARPRSSSASPTTEGS